MDTTRCYVAVNRAVGTRALAMRRRGPVAEGPARAGFGNGAAFNITAVVSGELPSKIGATGAQAASTVGGGRCFMTAVPNEAQLDSRGVASSEQSSVTRYARQRVRAQRDSPFACLRCFCERNGMEQRRRRTAVVAAVACRGWTVSRRRSPSPGGVKCSEAESSESRVLPHWHCQTCARQSAVFGVAVKSKAQARSDGRAQAP